MVEGALYLCTVGRICSRCTGFVAMTTWHRMRNVCECFYSIYAWLLLLYRRTIWKISNVNQCPARDYTRWLSCCWTVGIVRPITDDLTSVTVIWDNSKTPLSDHWTVYVSVLNVGQWRRWRLARQLNTKSRSLAVSQQVHGVFRRTRRIENTNVEASKFTRSWQTVKIMKQRNDLSR